MMKRSQGKSTRIWRAPGTDNGTYCTGAWCLTGFFIHAHSDVGELCENLYQSNLKSWCRIDLKPAEYVTIIYTYIHNRITVYIYVCQFEMSDISDLYDILY